MELTVQVDEVESQGSEDAELVLNMLSESQAM